MVCKFSEALGKPGEGIHFHFMGVAVVDVILSLLLAWFISNKTVGSFALWSFVVLLAGVVAHRIFCVRTTVDKILFRE